MRVLKSAAVRVAGTHPAIPSGKRGATRFWGFAGGVVIVAGIVYAFFGGWYWALIGIVVGFGIEAANRQSAQQFIAETAESNATFKAEMVASGIVLDD